MRRCKTISGRLRVALALREGVSLGNEGPVRCHYCRCEGTAHWWRCCVGTARERPSTWVVFVMQDERGRIETMEIDHVVPVCRGGRNTAANLVLSCRRCNRSKGANAEPARALGR